MQISNCKSSLQQKKIVFIVQTSKKSLDTGAIVLSNERFGPIQS